MGVQKRELLKGEGDSFEDDGKGSYAVGFFAVDVVLFSEGG